MEKEKIKEYHKKWEESNKEKRKEQHRKRYLDTIEEKKKYDVEYRKIHKEERNKYNEEYIKAHKEKAKEYQKQWEENHKEERKEQRRKHYQENKEEIAKYTKTYMAKKRANDIGFRIACNLRARVNEVINKKWGRTMDLVGCSTEELVKHLENQFQDGMSWENYGRSGWHIDHIRPCASFDLMNEEEQKQCFHYTNLQPLWAIDNLRKSSKWLIGKQ